MYSIGTLHTSCTSVHTSVRIGHVKLYIRYSAVEDYVYEVHVRNYMSTQCGCV